MFTFTSLNNEGGGEWILLTSPTPILPVPHPQEKKLVTPDVNPIAIKI